MKSTIVISGGSGLIGNRLIQLMDKSKYHFRILSRSKRKSQDNVEYFQWDPSKGQIELDALKDADHLITLAGAGIADKRWTKARKKLIIDSRVLGNELLAESLKKINHKPKSIVAGSAIGFYGNRSDELLTEDSPIGKEEFLTKSTRLWENSIEKLNDCTEHLSLIRIGIVLSTKGGALEKMMMPMRLGVSGYFGSGNQYYSWIHIDDLCNLIQESMLNSNYKGIINGVSPSPITLKEMAKEIKNLFLPVAIAAPVPGFMLKLAMGEMTAMLTNSTRVIPSKANELGFDYQFTEVKKAVEDLKDRKI